jgi:cell division septum initiation protein DivIVA
MLKIALKKYEDRPATTQERRELLDKIERLQTALKPFAAAVFNDNGDMTISPVTEAEPYKAAYFASRANITTEIKP